MQSSLKLVFLSLFYLSFQCGGTLAVSDTSFKIETYEARGSIRQAYKILGNIETERCGIWERFTTYDIGFYKVEIEAKEQLKQVAKTSFGENCDAIINIDYSTWKENKYAPCPDKTNNTKGYCDLIRWCVKAFGEAVSWKKN